MFIAIFSAGFLLGPRMLNIDSDLGRHLTLGGYILDQLSIPTRDLFSHTLSGQPRPAYEWLSQLWLAVAYRLAGLDGVVLLVSFVIASTFTFVYAQAVRRSKMPLVALAFTVLAASASSLHWLPRPHIITFLMLFLWLNRLEALQRGERVALWHFPVLMLVWANLHGGFIFGFLIWLAYLAGWLWDTFTSRYNAQLLSGKKHPPLPISAHGKQLLTIGFLALAASLLTPSGWGNWLAVLNNHSSYILRQTLETLPPNFRQPGTWPFLIIALLAIVLGFSNRKNISASHVFLLAGLGAASLLAGRNIPLFAIAAAPILAEQMRGTLKKCRGWLKIETRISALQKPLRGTVWPVLFGLGLILLIGNKQIAQKDPLMQFDGRVFPVHAVDWLAAHPQSGLMFNDINWGGYLLLRLWPGERVFLDTQTDFFGEALVREYERVVTAGPGWEISLADRGIEWVIVKPTSGLVQVLRERKEWAVVYEDEIAIILSKTKTETGP